MSQTIRELPILPLPNTVLFPRTLLPLDIQEPKMCKLVADAIEKDEEIGLVLLQPGWERNNRLDVSVYNIGSIGEIAEHRPLDEGGYQILVRGQGRFAITEFSRVLPYHVARVELLEDELPTDRKTRKLGKDLVRYFHEMAVAISTEPVRKRMLEHLDFHTLVNSVCASLNMSVYEKQRMLELGDLLTRGQAIFEILRTQVHEIRLISQFRHLQPEDARVN